MRITVRGFCLIITLIGLNFSSSAATEPENSQLTILGLSVGRDTLETVQEKLGPSKPCVASEHLTTLGYIVGNETLLFESSDIGGGDITGLILRPSKIRSACDLSSPKTTISSLRTDGGVHLGMKKKEFTTIFGSPKSKKRDGTYVYRWEKTENLTDAQQKAAAKSFPGAAPNAADVLTTVEARFSTTGLTYFYVSRIKSL
jgi:hypothetical protein